MLFALHQPLDISASWARPYPGDDDSDYEVTVSQPSSPSSSQSVSSPTKDTGRTVSVDRHSSSDDSDSFENIKRNKTEQAKLHEYFAGLQGSSQV